jgi:hypothetical protein
MRSLAPLLFVSVLVFAPLGRSQERPTQTASAALPVEVHITGPRLIRRADKLSFHVTLTNRSDTPIAIRFPEGTGDSTETRWLITDSGGRVLPPYVYTGPVMFYCPVTSGPSDLSIIVLQPQESVEYPQPGDPSDSYVFPGKGFYRVSLKYVLDPASRVPVALYRPPDEPPGPYTPQQKIEMLRKMPHLEVTSNVWQVYLSD